MPKEIDYGKQMFLYGITTIILVLEHFEKTENYEECHKIIKAIHVNNERLGIGLPTRITKESIADCLKVYKSFGMTGENMMENSKHFADQIIREFHMNNRDNIINE